MTVTVLHGDCRDILPTLPADSFDCIVTSPPYWGLRDYGVDGQIGLEPTMQGYLETMVGVCRELRRVLRPDGTFWLNVGDSYASAQKGSGGTGKSTLGTASGGNGISADGIARSQARQSMEARRVDCELPDKNLCLIPNRLAILLQEPWYRGRIKRVEDRIWLAAMIDGEGCMFIHKRKAGDGAHSSYTKKDGTVSQYLRTQDTYGAGLEVSNTSLAIIERCIAITGIGSICTQGPEQNARRRQTIYRWNVRSNECRWVIEEIYPHLVAKQQQARVLLGCPSAGERAAAAHAALIDLHNGKPSDDFPPPASLYEPGWFVRSEIVWAKKNCMPESVRDRPTCAHEKVWLLTKSERYFYDADAIAEVAVFPGVRCSTPYSENAVGSTTTTPYNGNKKDTKNARNVWSIASQPYSGAHFATMPPALAERCIKAGCPQGGTVLDPFGGAGTTGLVADRLGRNATLIELNPQYRELAAERVRGDAPLFADVSI